MKITKSRPVGRTLQNQKPKPTGLASGLTEKAIKAFRLAKEQQAAQADTGEKMIPDKDWR